MMQERIGESWNSPAPPDDKPILTIAATFTAEPIEESIAFWFRKLNLPFGIQFAPYNQVFQELIGTETLLFRNRNGVNLVLLRLQDWQKGGSLSQATDEFIAVLTTAAAQSAVPYVVCLCPPSPDAAGATEIANAEKTIAAAFAERTTVHVVTSIDVNEIYNVGEYYSPHTDEIGHIPYTTPYFTALGTMVARRIWALRSRPHKVIALDCDGTLWNGTCGEDGPDGVEFGPACTALQEFMVKQAEAGMLLCICSKNSPQDVFAVFDRRRDEMPLRREHIVSWRVNWTAKSENLRSLAKELDLGLDSVIMVDDSPIECAEIEANAPEVLTLKLPTEPQRIPTFLRRIWAFDHFKVTGEDKQRTEHYRANAQRETVRSASPTLEDFLRGLELEVEVRPLDASQLERVAQLTQRTNQFNVSGIRRTVSELQEFCERGGADCLVVKVRDRFGDYGLVGVVIYETKADALVVDSFMLSCRALGRRVEHRMLAELGARATRLGLGRVDVPFSPSPKNKPARDFLESLGREPQCGDDGRMLFRFASDGAVALGEHRPVNPLLQKQA
jgi:FkbH-like protein